MPPTIITPNLENYLQKIERCCGPQGLSRIELQTVLNIKRSSMGRVLELLRLRDSSQGRLYIASWLSMSTNPDYEGGQRPRYAVTYSDATVDAPRPAKLTNTEVQRRMRQRKAGLKPSHTIHPSRKASPWDQLLGVHAA